MPHPAQPDVAIIVPKVDELVGVLEALGEERLPKPSDSIQYVDINLETYRLELNSTTAGETISIGVVCLNRQTNTYSGPLTAAILDHLNPKQAYLIGTSLGNPNRSPVGSIIVATEVIDISERRPNSNNQHGWMQNSTAADQRLLSLMQRYIRNNYRSQADVENFYSTLRSPFRSERYDETRSLFKSISPKIDCEKVVSGNEYIMHDETRDALWERFGSCDAFDMEAAGFCLAATLKKVPWLVIRAVSDHGNRDSRADRTLVTKGAAQILRDFLKSGESNLQEVCSPRSNLAAIELSLAEEEFEGFMGYIDDSRNVVVYAEHVKFSSDTNGYGFIGKVTSALVSGDADHHLEYDVSISVTNSRFLAGTWANHYNYFGAIAGRRDEVKIEGTWLGTHGGGIRSGKFEWYNANGEQSGRERRDAFISRMNCSLTEENA